MFSAWVGRCAVLLGTDLRMTGAIMRSVIYYDPQGPVHRRLGISRVPQVLAQSSAIRALFLNIVNSFQIHDTHPLNFVNPRATQIMDHFDDVTLFLFCHSNMK